jgi:hypothetical protein
VIACLAVVVVTVNASSDYMEMTRAGRAFVWWEPVLWEATSAAVILAMAPLVGRAVRRWRPSGSNLIKPLAIHAGLTIPFAAGHILGIWALREAVYALAGLPYGFFDDGVGLVAFYEWRKDALTYASIAGVYWLFDHLARRNAPPAAAARDERLELRDGGAAMFVPPAEITHIEAAGNYVEVHMAGRSHLVRGTLAAFETRLAPRGFVRVHRSRLVNRAKIAAIKPTASGDLEIALLDGRVLAGSRRYRAGLAI